MQSRTLAEPTRPRSSRRSLLMGAVAAGASAVALGSMRRAHADDGDLPIPLQAELLAKVVAYDRNFLQRAGERVRIGLLVRQSENDSVRAGEQMRAVLSRIPTI